MKGEGRRESGYIEKIRKAIKEFESISDIPCLNYEYFCIYPNLDLPEGFKIPTINTSKGIGNPMSHLRAYYDQLVGVGRDEALLMRILSRSLCRDSSVGMPRPRNLLFDNLWIR